MKKISGLISLLGIIGTAGFFIYGLKKGIFYDVESLRQFIGGFGPWICISPKIVSCNGMI